MVQLKGDEKARYVSAMFDRISRRYDRVNTIMTAGMHHRWRRIGARLATQNGSGQTLDVATGTGDFALALARRPEVEQVIGLDFAPQMLPLAHHKAERQRLSHRVHWMLGDALALPFPDDHFLCATVGFGLRNFSDKEAALREMVRVVRPGGRVVILDIVPLDDRGVLHRLLRVYTRRIVPKLGTWLTGNKEAYAYLPDSVDGYLTAQQLAEMMESVGLQEVSYKTMGFGTVALHVGEKTSLPHAMGESQRGDTAHS